LPRFIVIIPNHDYFKSWVVPNRGLRQIVGYAKSWMSPKFAFIFINDFLSEGWNTLTPLCQIRDDGIAPEAWFRKNPV
jgi:hypothetical protein